MIFHKALITTATFAGLLASGVALAHSDAYLDTQTAPHGGQLRMTASYHLELVVTGPGQQARSNPVVVHVTDHAGAKLSTAEAKGVVTLLAGKSRTTVQLKPDGDNRLKGAGVYAATPDMKAIVSVTLPGKATEQARFTPFARQADHSDHAAH
ncbi:MAG: hypothetical protein KBF81_05320 [Aquabacterium sp.]|nr:hypothetical protein [Aquabacterium sp.]